MIKDAAAIALDTLALVPALLRSAHPPTIFMFHSIGTESPVPLMARTAPVHSPELFDRFLRCLTARADVISLPELFERISRGCARSGRPTAVLTFDDGYVDNYTIAYPLLARYRCPATFFVTVGLIGGRGWLSTQMLREMHKDGMTIGSHTVNHPALPRISPGNAGQELRQSKAILEDLLGVRCSTFSYPYGDFNAETKRLVQEMGYDCAVSAWIFEHPADLFSLPRCVMSLRFSTAACIARLYGAQSWRGLFFRRRQFLPAERLPPTRRRSISSE
jgi:peptidoglycan/xylan/chitin deacetylase (PgdA/CDA1 family)